MEFVEVGDLGICCELTGEGYPIVLIQGFTANMDWWDPGLLQTLSQQYRVLAFDNRGAGRTVTPEEGDWTTETFADDTAALMEAMGIERANIFGTSMGGMISQELALKYPEKVNKLVLGSTFCGDVHTVYASQEVLEKLIDSSGGPEEVLQRTTEMMFTQDSLKEQPEVVEGFKIAWMRAPTSKHNAMRQYMAAAKIDTYNRLPEINIPTLVVTGKEDILIPPENSRIIAERIPGAKLIEYEVYGHSFISRMPEAFINDLLEFLAS
jgi:pimeloyl-ACP methyl ester carboxylesterase